jgi:O-antigen/teichoic acid export membrane protein
MSEIAPQATASKHLSSAQADQDVLTAAKGGGIVFAGHLFQYASRFIISFFLARLLGADQIGLCNLALTAAMVASGLAQLGLPSAMVRYVSLFAGRKDEAGLWGMLQVGVGLVAVVSLLMAGGLFALAGPIAEQLFHEPKLAPLLRVISLVVPFLALSRVIASATRGFKRMQYLVISQSISQPAIRLVLALVLAITIGLNAARSLVAFGVAVVFSFGMLLYFLNQLFPLNRPLSAARYNPKKMLRFALPVYLSSLISIFGGNIKTMLLGALNTAANVGVFAIAFQINTIGRMFHDGIVTASAPIVSELYDRGEREPMGRFYQTVTKWTFTMNLPLFLIVLLFPVPILSIFGKSFVDGAAALSVLAWANLVDTGTGICGVVLDMTGRTSLKFANSLVTFALTIGLNALLIPRWGLMGAATASLAAAVTINLLRLSEIFVLFRLLPYDVSFVKPVVAGLVTLAIAWGVRLFSPSRTSLVYTAMNVIVLLVVYVGMIFLLGLSQEDRAVLDRLRRRMGRMLPRS